MKTIRNVLLAVLRWLALDIAPGAAIVFFGGMVAVQLYPTLTRGALNLTPFEKVQIVIYVLFAGGAAAIWKRKDQYRYGFTELIFAGALAWRLASAQLTTEPMTNLVMLVTAAYVASRAFQNIHEGLQKTRERTKNPLPS